MRFLYRRRDFIALLGAATAASPLAVVAQAPAPPIIGFLSNASAGPAEPLVTAFRCGLERAGYVEGRNVAIEYRWAQGIRIRAADQRALDTQG